MVRWLSATTTVWRFGRPHTLVGTALSVAALFVLATFGQGTMGAGPGIRLLAITLAASLSANVFVVGLNQLRDLALDRINKPDLPLPAGHLDYRAAMLIVASAAILALALGAASGPVLLATLAASMAVGTAYSLPPMYLKRRAATAATAISLVRGPLVNLGVFAHFRLHAGADPTPTAPVILLAVFMTLFAMGIAILKDVPDVAGDRHFRLSTVAVRHGPRSAFRLGVLTIATAYAVVIAACVASAAAQLAGAPHLAESAAHLAAAHLVGLFILIAAAQRVNTVTALTATGFYRLVWGLFYAEYIVVPLIIINGL